MKKIKLLLPLLVLVLTLVALVGCNESQTKDLTNSYVVLDINPSVELVLDKDEVVEYANALNEDADLLLVNIDLEGLSAEAAIDLIIEEATKLGFIDPEAEETIVDVTTVTEDEEDDEALGEKIRENVNNAFTKRGMHGYAQMSPMTPEIIAEAEELGIGAGVLRLMKQAQELNPELTLEELLEMSVRDLIGIVKVRGNEVRGMSHQLRQDFFDERDLLRAEYQPQFETLRTQIEALEAQIEAELDEEAKAVLEAELAVLVASLNELREALNQDVADKREEFLNDATALMDQVRADALARAEAHRAAMDAFRDHFEENEDAIKEQLEEWMNDHRMGNGRN